MLGWARTGYLWLHSAVDQVLLRKLQQEVRIELDVEVDVVHCSLGLLNVQIQALVEHADRLGLVAFEAPLDQSFQKVVVWRLWRVLIAQLGQKFELPDRVFVLLLLDPAEDHAVEREKVSVVKGRCPLVSLVSLVEIAEKSLLVAHFTVEEGILRLKHDCEVQDPQSFVDDDLFASTVSCEKLGNVKEEVRVFALDPLKHINQLVHLFLAELPIILSGKQVEDIDAQGFNILFVLCGHSRDDVDSLIPFIVLDVQLRFFDLRWLEVREADASFGQNLDSDVVLFGFFKDFSLA